MANNLFKSLFSDGDSDNQEEYYDEQTPVPPVSYTHLTLPTN